MNDLIRDHILSKCTCTSLSIRMQTLDEAGARGFWVTMDESIFFYRLVLCGTIELTRLHRMGMEAVGDVRLS